MVDARILSKPEFNIYPSPSEFVLNKTGSDQWVTIRRDTGAIVVDQRTTEASSKGIDCFGTLGTITLIATKYLLVITQA
jgi:hypothetical protein